MNIVLYTRVSTDEQAERYGLPAQLRACRDYATAQGHRIVAELSDEGISGATLNRPALDRAREMVRRREDAHIAREAAD